jgi:S-adenosylmethionine hydrolase
MPSCIALLTDFGVRDTYVAAMKAVILGRIPSATMLDLTHEISPGNIQQGAFEIWRIRPYLPDETVLLGVVDPGVGTARKPIAIEFPGLRCVGPDNGLFTYLLEAESHYTAVELDRDLLGLKNVSQTFHGRDLFSPAAAHLASGAPLDSVGFKRTSLHRIASPHLTSSGSTAIEGEILHIDGYGNLITSIGRLEAKGDLVHFDPWLEGPEAFEFAQEQVRIQITDVSLKGLTATFGNVSSGERLAYIGSAGLLEIAIRDGSAALSFKAQIGDRVTITLL